MALLHKHGRYIELGLLLKDNLILINLAETACFMKGKRSWKARNGSFDLISVSKDELHLGTMRSRPCEIFTLNHAANA